MVVSPILGLATGAAFASAAAMGAAPDGCSANLRSSVLCCASASLGFWAKAGVDTKPVANHTDSPKSCRARRIEVLLSIVGAFPVLALEVLAHEVIWQRA